MLLKIDPPDPQWRRLALAEPFPRPRAARCTLRRGCAKLDRARKRLAVADARVLELQEALAVAANRYGNAVGQDDRAMQALHEATMRATSGMLADAHRSRHAAAVALVGAIRATGVRSLVVSRAAVTASAKHRRAGRGVPKAAVRRLLRRHLITSAAEVTAMLRKDAATVRAAPLDVLKSLGRPARTTQMRAAGAEPHAGRRGDPARRGAPRRCDARRGAGGARAAAGAGARL